MHKTLKTYFGFDSFRPLQEEIILNILKKEDCLVLMPTGGGKSLCYQIPAMMMDGTAIVVSPLISLMKDQVESLCSNGIPAAALNSNNDEETNQKVFKEALMGRLKLLYISPEKLIAEKNNLLQRMKISLFAIDEAHCISHWGHDFRPEYTQLGILHQFLPNVPIAAFTATADKITKADIIEQMKLKPSSDGQVRVFCSSFDRPNLSLDVRCGYSAKDKLKLILSTIRKHKNDSGIIYCLSRRGTEELANKLLSKGIKAAAYHAGMLAGDRNRVQEDFVNENIDVVCATIAFGMGIDKSNVRFIIHFNLPKSIESYYQEIGRGGRDGLPCETILFYTIGDLNQLRKFAEESGQREINIEKLNRVSEYAESHVCRRRILLNYFGEEMNHNCTNCDVCKNPPRRFDGSVLVQKALSAIKRTGEKIGFSTTIDILRGQMSPDVNEHNYYTLKTFGVGRDVSTRDWQNYLLQMLHLGYFEIDYNDNQHLKVTQQGQSVLLSETKAELSLPVSEDFSVKGRRRNIGTETSEKNFNQDSSNDLFAMFKALRRKIAGRLGIAPYTIFSDATLRLLADEKPETITESGRISGIGRHKMEHYCKEFIKLIRIQKGLDCEADKSWEIIEVTEEREPVYVSPIIKKEPKFKPRKSISVNRTRFELDPEINSNIDWCGASAEVRNLIRWNLWQDTMVPIKQFIPDETELRDEVVKRFIEVLTEGYELKVKGEIIMIPRRIELDCNGNPVHTLLRESFEDGLQQFVNFLESNQHFPYAKTDEYECSLLRWYQEVKRGVIFVTPEQSALFEQMEERYASLPKYQKQD